MRSRIRLLVGSARRLLASTVVRLTSIRRRVLRPIDRRRHPSVPALVVTLEGQAPGEFDPKDRELYAGSRSRLATASDLVWIDDRTIMAIYLLTDTVAEFRFSVEEGTPRVDLLESVSGRSGLEQLDSIAVAPDGTWIIATNTSRGCVSLIALDSGHSVASAPVYLSNPVHGDRNLHGVATAPTGDRFVYTSIDKPGGLRVVRVEQGPGGRFDLIVESIIENEHWPLVPKGVAFTPNGRHLIIAYGLNAGRLRLRPGPGFIEVRRYDSDSGAVGEITSVSDPSLRLLIPESISVLGDGSEIVVTDQALHAALVLPIDQSSGTLGQVKSVLSWAAGGLSFPHGSAFSPDGRWLGLTNFGDGTIRVFDRTMAIGAERNGSDCF